MNNDEEMRLNVDPDWIAIKRYKNSIEVLEKRYPDGCPAHIIARALGITEDEVEERYQKIITCIRIKIGVS